MMDVKKLAFTPNLEAFDYDKPQRTMHQVFKVWNSIQWISKGQKIGVEGMKKKMLSEFKETYEDPAPGSPSLDIDRIGKNQLKVLHVGYVLLKALDHEGEKAHNTCVQEINIDPWTLGNAGKIFKAVYRLGMQGNAACPLAMINPDKDGLCTMAQIPGGAEKVFFFSEYRDDKLRNSRARKMASASLVADKTDDMPEATPNSNRRGRNTRGDLTQKVEAPETSIQASIDSLLTEAMGMSPTDRDGIEKLAEVLAQLEKLHLGHKEKPSNVNVCKMIRADKRLNLNEASQALEECRANWPLLFEMHDAAVLDATFIKRVSRALYGLKDDIRIPYNRVSTFLMILISVIPKGEQFEKLSRKDWSEFVRRSDADSKLVCASQQLDRIGSGSEEAFGDAETYTHVTHTIVTLQNVVNMLTQVSAGGKSAMANNFGWSYAPPIVSRGEALRRAAETTSLDEARAMIYSIDHSSVKLITDQIDLHMVPHIKGDIARLQKQLLAMSRN